MIEKTEGQVEMVPQEHERIVIVGASLAGLRAAEALRREGFAGKLTIVGDEPSLPYDRPPLSKYVLTGWLPVEHTSLAHFEDVRAEWKLGVAARALDLSKRTVYLDDGQHLDFDRLLIATGTRARPWPEQLGGTLDGVFLLRNRDDASKLRRRFIQKLGRVLIIGGGFIGCEVAAVCRELGFAVTIVERGPSLLLSSLGQTIGSLVTALQRERGVDVLTERTVTLLEGDAAGHVCRAHLSDGSSLETDLVIVALGAVRNTEWLHNSGLLADTRGVVCDASCRALDIHGVAVDGVFVAGDVARWPHKLHEGGLIAVEHWGNAVEQAENAAHNMVSEPSVYRMHTCLPAFWSTIYDVNIKGVGLPDLADEVIITQGSVEQHRFVAVYGRKGRMVAAVSFNMGFWLDAYRDMIEAQASYPPLLSAADQPAEMQLQGAGFPTLVR